MQREVFWLGRCWDKKTEVFDCLSPFLSFQNGSLSLAL